MRARAGGGWPSRRWAARAATSSPVARPPASTRAARAAAPRRTPRRRPPPRPPLRCVACRRAPLTRPRAPPPRRGRRTKKVGISGKYGTRYGASLRKIVRKIEVTQHATVSGRAVERAPAPAAPPPRARPAVPPAAGPALLTPLGAARARPRAPAVQLHLLREGHGQARGRGHLVLQALQEDADGRRVCARDGRGRDRAQQHRPLAGRKVRRVGADGRATRGRQARAPGAGAGSGRGRRGRAQTRRPGVRACAPWAASRRRWHRLRDPRAPTAARGLMEPRAFAGLHGPCSGPSLRTSRPAGRHVEEGGAPPRRGALTATRDGCCCASAS